MGRYISWETLQAKYKAVSTNRDSTQGDSYISAAEDEIDARVGHLYTVPFSPVPGIIKNLAHDLAWAQMNITNAKISDPMFKRIDKLFDAICDREIALVVSGTVIDPESQVFLTTSGTGTSFGMDDVTRFRVDSNWQQSFASDRGDFSGS
jgi:phage gp36-like protein